MSTREDYSGSASFITMEITNKEIGISTGEIRRSASVATPESACWFP